MAHILRVSARASTLTALRRLNHIREVRKLQLLNKNIFRTYINSNIVWFLPQSLSMFFFSDVDPSSGSDDTPQHKATAPTREASPAQSCPHPPNAPSLQRRNLPPRHCSPLGTALLHKARGTKRLCSICVCVFDFIPQYKPHLFPHSCLEKCLSFKSYCGVLSKSRKTEQFVCDDLSYSPVHGQEVELETINTAVLFVLKQWFFFCNVANYDCSWEHNDYDWVFTHSFAFIVHCSAQFAYQASDLGLKWVENDK